MNARDYADRYERLSKPVQMSEGEFQAMTLVNRNFYYVRGCIIGICLGIIMSFMTYILTKAILL